MVHDKCDMDKVHLNTTYVITARVWRIINLIKQL